VPAKGHSADGAALGFYFQTQYALLVLLRQNSDNAAVGVEGLDDVTLAINGQSLLHQLKHSISATPPAITVSSRALWKTIKVWVDCLPYVTLSETRFQLVAVGDLDAAGPLGPLLSRTRDRAPVLAALTAEATRVLEERAEAARNNLPLPHGERVAGCEALLGLAETQRLSLLRRVTVERNAPNIADIETEIAAELYLLPKEYRSQVTQRLVEWWDRQVVFSLCGKRPRVIARVELQECLAELIADIETAKLLPEFEHLTPPESYQPNGMLARQIALVGGQPSDQNRAQREEWRAREQRSKWINNKMNMASVIAEYDEVLKEHWSDLHLQMTEESASLDDQQKRAAGLKVLRWSHEIAPTVVRPIASEWSAPYYVRGSYQVLAIELNVGWHPDFAKLLTP